MTVSGNAEEARVNNGNAMINTKTVGKLTAFDEAGENVRLTVNENNNIVIERDVIDQITGDVRKTQTVTAKVSDGGSLTVKDLDKFDNADASFTGDITVKGNAQDFTIGSVDNLEFNNGVDGDLTIGTSVKSITAKDADGNLKDISDNLDVAQNTGEINVGTVGGNAKFSDAQGKVTTSDITGNLDVVKNTGEINVGNVGGKMTLGGAQGAVLAASANGVDATLNGGSLKINGEAGDVNLKGTGTVENIAASNSLTFTGDFNGQAQFGTISGDVNANGNFVKDLTIGTAAGSVDLADVNKLVIERATGGKDKSVSVDNVNNLNVWLSNDTDLIVNGEAENAKVNGGCDAKFVGKAGTILVDDHLNGTLTMQSGVDVLNIKNVTTTVVENGAGSVTAKFDDRVASMDIDSVSGDMSVDTTQEVKLKIGNVDGLTNFFGTGDITIYDSANASFQTFSFEDGSITLDNSEVKFNGDVNGRADMNIESSTVNFATKLETAGDVKIVNSTVRFADNSDDRNSVVLKAAKLYGTSAKEMIDFLYNDTYGIGEDVNQSSLTKHTLVGDHKDDGKIIAELGDDVDTAINVGHIKGSFYNNAENRVAFKIEKNSFFTDNVRSENEKAFAQVLDSAEYTGNDASDERAVAVKRNYYNLAQNGGFASALPQAVSRAARMNMDLANIVHLDAINRTSATRDMLNAYGKKLNEFGRSDSLVRGTSFVTVRNINRFASYGGDSYASGSNDYIYGGLVNAEYLVNEDLFAGLGVGGFQAKSSGKDNSGKAETQSFALNLYGDYAFYDGFDWYFGATYAFGMNKTDRQRGAEIATSDWNSNLVGVFSGVRYTWKPFEDQSIAIKPLVGVNANFLFNPSYDEDAGGLDKLSIEERDYSSFKTIVGVEAVKAFDFGLSVAARMFYTHEFADNSYNVGATLGDSYRTYGSFVYRGYEMDRDGGIFGVGLGYDINKDWRVYLDYAAEVADDVYHNLNAGVQFKF